MSWSTLDSSSSDLDVAPNGEGCKDQVILNQWYPIAAVVEIKIGLVYRTVLLETSVSFGVSTSGVLLVWKSIPDVFPAGSKLISNLIINKLPIKTAFGYLWTTLGSNPKDLFLIPEIDEPDRRTMNAGSIGISTSAPRAVENFLDMGHFPFVHSGVLGAEPRTEVVDYNIEIKDGEVIASGCKFPQPKAGAGSVEGIITDYLYRVPHPYCVLLYKSGSFETERLDVVGLFLQPITQEKVRGHMLLSLLDNVTSDTAIKKFQLGIFSQDKPILENQVPKRLPLSTLSETPIRADKSSIAYRRWLSEMGVNYGVISDTESDHRNKN